MKAPFSNLTKADLDNLREQANQRIAHKEAESESQRTARKRIEQELKDEKARRKRRARAKADFAFFCKTYMPQAFSLDFAPYQLALTRVVAKRAMTKRELKLFKSLINKDDHETIVMPKNKYFDGILDLEPRDHGKTTRNTQALPMWLALNFGDIYAIVCGASSESAISMMDAIKSELETNELIINDYGVQKVYGNKWAQDKIELANGNAIQAAGRGEPIRGTKHKFLRPTHVICDDLIKDDEVENQAIRNKTEDWFDKVVLNLGKGMLVIVANTIVHPDDLPSRLLARIEAGLLPDWLGLRFAAITPSGQPLFPQRWPLRDLLKKKLTLRNAWWSEWMNKPRSKNEKDFKPEWFKHYQLHDLDFRDLDIIMAVDPATGLETGDYSAIAIVGRHKVTMIDYVIFCNGWHESDDAFAHRILEVYLWCANTFNKAPSKMLFETVAFQKIYRNSVERYAKKYGVRLPLVSYKPEGNKKQRLKSLSPSVETGGLQFLEHQTLLKSQLEQFPKGNDDCHDAVEMCCSEFETKQFVGGAQPNVIRKALTAAKELGRAGRRKWRVR